MRYRESAKKEVAINGAKADADSRWLAWLAVFAVLILAVLLSGSFWLWWRGPRPPVEPNLEEDLKLMWETQPLKTSDPSHGPNPRASSERAIDAAERVFNRVELVGKTGAEVIDLLGEPKSSGSSIYNLPFYPVPKGTLVYRFDNGAYGWQFNVLLDADGKVSKVEREGIE